MAWRHFVENLLTQAVHHLDERQEHRNNDTADDNREKHNHNWL